MKHLILLIFLIATMSIAAKPTKNLSIEVCTSRLCYVQKLDNVARFEKLDDPSGREFMRFYHADGRITDVRTDGATLTIKK